MKFTLDRATNCDASNLLINNETARKVMRQQSIQAGKKLVSTLFCCCCCVDNPSTSLLVLKGDKLGIPPQELTASANGHFVISYVEQDNNGIEQKIPLLFTAEENIARGLLSELSEIYIKSNQMTAIFGTIRLDELDSQAKVWSRLFGFPEKSNGTQQLDFNNAWGQQGGSLPDFARTYQKQPFEVHSLAPTPLTTTGVSTNSI